MEFVLGYIKSRSKMARSYLLNAAAQSPSVTLALVILICCFLLPLVSATALMPLVIMVSIGDYLETKGFLSVIYITCFQGLLLVLVLMALFTTAFMVATGANIIHSKYYWSSGKR